MGMSWREALNKWNSDRPGFIIPAKGTPQYAEIRALMESQDKTD